MSLSLHKIRQQNPRFFPFIILLFIVVVIPLTIAFTKHTQTTEQHATGGSPCQFASAPGTVPAFCDSFDTSAGTGNRSGDLNGTIWGVSRISTGANFGQQQFDSWNPSTAAACNTQPLQSPRDVQICNGQFVETVNDGGTVSPEGNGGQTVLAAYPKQPFDFAGRTGKVVFDVGDDTHGGHTAWPAFAITNLPVPAPYGTAPGLTPFAPNSFGFSLAGLCGPGSCGAGCNSGTTVDSAYITNNYVFTQLTSQQGGCVKQPTQFGQLNHFEVDFSLNEVDIYATDAGADPSTQRLIAKYTGFTMPLTRGFIWMEDVHYNACKYSETQCNHTFAWDNVGFDGPLLPRDLSYDVLDNTTNGNLGWLVSGGAVTLNTVPTVTAANLAAAQGAVVTLNVEPDYNVTSTLQYSLNGGPTHTYAWPANLGVGAQWPGLALPIPSLSEVKTGTNTITISSTGGNTMVANVDLKLLGAGGIPGTTPSPCQFQKADPGYTVAFCDTFDAAAGTGNRSGDVNGLVWGASRLSGNTNPTQGILDGWQPTQEDQCGTTRTVQPEGDIHSCNNRFVEATDDGGSVTRLAMYPTQPFDIAGRTGTVTFDVNSDNLAGHGAWPAFVYTDQPVPAPGETQSGSSAYARNSFGFELALNQCPNGPGHTGVNEMFTTNNYALNALNYTILTCVKNPTQEGQLNHFEVRISATHVEVWGTDAGSNVLQEIAVANNVTIPLTRGLIWIEDEHYNGDKDGANQSIHTFQWDNVGFDGPILPGDIHLDVNDALTGPDPRDGSLQLGWGLPDLNSTPLTLQIPGATANNISQASGAIVTLNYSVSSPANLQYRLNGKSWHTQTWPFADSLDGWRTIALPVDLNTEVVQGTNTLDLRVGGGGTAANVDLIFIGARNTGGTSVPTNTPVPISTTPTNSPSPTNTPTLTPTPLPTGPTIGNTHQGVTLDDGDANSMNGTKVTTGSTPASVVSISAFVGSVDISPNNKFQMAIYTDASGVPGTLVAQTSSGTLTANSWNTLPLTTSLLANTSYWLMYNTNGSNGNVNNVFFDTGSPQMGAFVTSGQPFGTFPANFGAATLGNWNFSLYVTLSGVGGGSTLTPVPPTVTPSRTPTPIPSTNPSPTITPVPTSLSTISLSLELKLHGLGNSGDNANLNGTGNLTPLHPQHVVTLTLYNTANQMVGNPVSTTVTYDSGNTKHFLGSVSLPSSTYPVGSYRIKLASSGYLSTYVTGILQLNTGPAISVPTTYLVTGDIKQDNKLDLGDYNKLLTDYGSVTPNDPADINDDGIVDLKDINLLLREFSVQGGN